MRAHTPFRRGAIFAVSTLLATVASAAAATAAVPTGDPAVWSITPEQQVVTAGVPARIALSGDASKTAAAGPQGDTAPAAALTVLPPGVACPASYAETVGEVYSRAYSWAAGSSAASPFTDAQAITFDQPGRYTACGYFGLTGTLSLPDDQDATTLAYRPVTIDVQRPTVGLTVGLDGPRYPNATVKLVGSATANAPETVSVQLNRAGQACEATATSNQTHDRFAPGPDPIPVYGSRQLATTVTLPGIVGDYHLCLYAARTGQDGDPDLAIDTASQPDGVVQIREAPVAPTSPPILYGTGRAGTTKPVCRITPFAPTAGQRVTVACKGITGTIVVGLKKATRSRIRHSRTLHLNRYGKASFSTRSIRPGAWYTRVTWDHKTAGSTNFYLKARPATAAKRTKGERAASRSR
jgi:hypothetical protein